LHIPEEILKKTSGTISILRSLRKISPRKETLLAHSGKNIPRTAPAKIPIKIFIPSEIFIIFFTF
jgi:hypothetical protein